MFLAGFMLTGALSVACGVAYRYIYLPGASSDGEARYGIALGQLLDLGYRRVVVVDDGIANEEGLTRYSPQLRYHVLSMERRGLTASVVVAAEMVHPGDVVLSCDQDRKDEVLALRGSHPILRSGGCVAVDVMNTDARAAGLPAVTASRSALDPGGWMTPTHPFVSGERHPRWGR
jgi:hypothetical protein